MSQNKSSNIPLLDPNYAQLILFPISITFNINKMLLSCDFDSRSNWVKIGLSNTHFVELKILLEIREKD